MADLLWPPLACRFHSQRHRWAAPATAGEAVPDQAAHVNQSLDQDMPKVVVALLVIETGWAAAADAAAPVDAAQACGVLLGSCGEAGARSGG